MIFSGKNLATVLRALGLALAELHTQKGHLCGQHDDEALDELDAERKRIHNMMVRIKAKIGEAT